LYRLESFRSGQPQHPVGANMEFAINKARVI
jgi:hypothetical protein